MPSSPSGADLAALAASPFAHRGLHGGGRIENSRAAFAAAIARGHGIELDVQTSRDGHAMVFHDYTLERLTGARGRLADRDAADLARIELAGTAETIPTLPEILDRIGGRVPLLIEVKVKGRDVAPLTAAVARDIVDYEGPVGVMSFNPEVGHWLADHAPSLPRGLVVTHEGKGWRGPIERRVAMRRADPHFLAVDVRDLPTRFAAAARARGLPLFTWTCRTPEQRAVAERYADQPIYEQIDA